MYELEFYFRADYKAYKNGIYNPAELIYLTIQGLKSFQFHNVIIKDLVRIVLDAVEEAEWRQDIYVYDEWHRKAHFGFLDKYDNSDYWCFGDVIAFDDPIETTYRPKDVAIAISKHWNQLYTDPCVYPCLIHLLEASDNLHTPPNFDERIRKFIVSASNIFDETRGLTQKEHCEASTFEWIRAHPYALSKEARKGSEAKGVQLP